MKVLLKNCNIIDTIHDYENLNDVLIENGRIYKIAGLINDEAAKVININGMTLMPGFIDLHCHLREPGFEYKETIKTGTQAAAKGGYTTVCCMPNTNPVIDNIDVLENLKSIILKNSLIEVIPIGAITKDQRGKELVDLEKMTDCGVRLFSDDGNKVWNN